MKFVLFLKIRLLFNIFHFSECLQTNISYISGADNSKSKCCCNAKHLAYYFCVKTKISVDFQIRISVLLSTLEDHFLYLDMKYLAVKFDLLKENRLLFSMLFTFYLRISQKMRI